MKHFPMKTYLLLTALSIPVMAASFTVSAEESNPYIMEPDTVYEIDIDNDGAAEQVSYSTWTDEAMVPSEFEEGMEYVSSQAVLEVYVDSELFWTITEDDWSYIWKLDQFALENGKQYFIASSIADNDYTMQTLLLSSDSETLSVVCDLNDITCESETNSDYLLSSWSRSGNVVDVSGNTFTLNWCDAFMSTGNIVLPVTYVVEEDIVSLTEPPYALDSEALWTAWIDIAVQASPEDETSVFHVAPNETVHLTEMTRYNGSPYFKCVNADGAEGWFKDPDHIVSQEAEDGSYLMGFFLEAVFAG